MGHIFILSGASGVGKTTFLELLVKSAESKSIRVIPRFTDRPQRRDESEGFEHHFVDHDAFLQRVYANDFLHVEKWGDYYSGIETRALEEVLKGKSHGIILASTFASSRLRATYGIRVTNFYMWTGERPSLIHPRCMSIESPEIKELVWRIQKKRDEDGFAEFEIQSRDDAAFIKKRMIDNFLDIAAVNGRLRSGEDIQILPNFHDRIEATLESFLSVARKVSGTRTETSFNSPSGCFVLMPFREEFFQIYEDHIQKTCNAAGLSVTRADQIFSTRAVIEDILECVASARIVIADLTNANPNVLYEVGICHALGKRVILITQEDEVPFDLRHLRRIRYDYTPRGMLEFERALISSIRQSMILE